MVNAILIPKLVYALQVCPLAKFFLSDMTTMINAFLWKSRAAAIAHGTLIRPLDREGLKLVDVRVKVQSLRLKLLLLLLSGVSEHVWHDYLREDVMRRGDCGLFNLCSLFFNSRIWATDPLFQEVADAWVITLRYVNRVVTKKVDVLAHMTFGKGGWVTHGLTRWWNLFPLW